MTIESFVAFNLALIAAIISPGPALLVAMRTTLVRGRKPGIYLGLGLGLVASMWTVAALLGFEMVFRNFPWAYVAAKMLGAIYLIYIAFSMWRGANESIKRNEQPARHAFLRGLAINLLNPKSVLFAAAVLIVVFPPNMSIAETAIVGGNHLIVEVTFYTLLALAMSSETVSTRFLRTKVYIDRTASMVLGGLGVRLLISK